MVLIYTILGIISNVMELTFEEAELLYSYLQKLHQHLACKPKYIRLSLNV